MKHFKLRSLFVLAAGVSILLSPLARRMISRDYAMRYDLDAEETPQIVGMSGSISSTVMAARFKDGGNSELRAIVYYPNRFFWQTRWEWLEYRQTYNNEPEGKLIGDFLSSAREQVKQ
jgi:hypothetical protein